MNRISNGINKIAYCATSQKAASKAQKIFTKLLETSATTLARPTIFLAKAEELKNTKILVIPSGMYHIKRGSMMDKILSAISKAFKEQ